MSVMVVIDTRCFGSNGEFKCLNSNIKEVFLMKKETVAISGLELRKFVEANLDSYIMQQAVKVVATVAGLSPKELFNVRWEDIDLIIKV